MNNPSIQTAGAAPAVSSTVELITGWGQRDSHKNSGTPYSTINGKAIVAMVKNPPSVPKADAQWIIPSTYHESDGREFGVQREKGEFWFLPLDEDGTTDNNLTLADVEEAVVGACGPVTRLIYSTRSSTAEKRKWRALIPLMRPISGADYADTVAAFNARLIEASGGALFPDPVFERPGQLIFLPNKGEFYECAPRNGDRLELTPDHPIIKHRDRIRAERAEIEAAARKRRDARKIKAMADPDGSDAIIEKFNAANTVADMLERHGYIMSRNGRDWRSPNSSTGSYAVRDFGHCWFSFSGSDDVANIGRSQSGGRVGDAFDLFVHYDHGGKFNDAIKAYAEEIGADYKSKRDRDAAQQLADLLARQRTAPGGAPGQEAGQGQGEAPPTIKPTPFALRASHLIPPRQWLYGKHLIRSFLSLTVAPGGVGKSSMVLIDALAMATGRALLGSKPPEPVRVWVWNGEDPHEEIERRIAAACIHYGINDEDLGGRLLVDSGRDLPITLATMDSKGVKVARPVADQLKAALKAAKIDVLIIDPFVTSHEVNENDNTAINAVAAEWRRIADEAGCAIELVHHTSKAGAANGDEMGIMASRGGGALIDAVRAARYLVRMTAQEAERFGLEDTEARVTFRVCTDGKANLAPPEKATWRQMTGISLGNGWGHWPEGDHVGVCIPWTPPDAFEGVTARDLRAVQQAIAAEAEPPRESDKSPDWAGFIVGDVISLDLGDRNSTKAIRGPKQNANRAKVRNMLREWFRSGALTIKTTKDAKGNERKIVTVGDPVRADEA